MSRLGPAPPRLENIQRSTPAARAIAVLCLVWLGGTPAVSRAKSVLDDPDFLAAVDRGLEKLYDFQFDAAAVELGAAASRYPGHPVEPFLKAMPGWWMALADPDDSSKRPAVRAALENVLDLADRRLHDLPRDPDGRFFRAAALACRGRLRTYDGEWIAAAWDGKRAIDLVRGLAAEQPGNRDLLFGLGLYDYYAEVVPRQYPLFRPLAAFFPRGDSRRGLQELARVESEGHFARVEAAFARLEIEYSWEDDKAAALAHAEDLRRRFPGNPIFHLYVARAHAARNEGEAMRTTCRGILDAARIGRTGYGRYQREAALYFLGRADFEERRLLEAERGLDALEREAAAASSESRWRTLGSLTRGMALDALGERSAAIAAYRLTLRLEDAGQAHDRAHRYLRRPWRPEAEPR